jgi:hypothetical protein
MRIKAPNALHKKILDCHIGVGVIVYKSGQGKTVESEVFVNRKTGRLHYIANGAPVAFDLDEENED